MNSEDLSDAKVRAFLINCIVNGLKTSIIDQDSRGVFARALCETINTEPIEAFAHGDEEGILIEDIAGDPIGSIMVQEGIIRFRSFLEFQTNKNPEQTTALFRAIMTTIGYTANWHADKGDLDTVQPVSHSVPIGPASGYIPGSAERGCEWDDDGFGIT